MNTIFQKLKEDLKQHPSISGTYLGLVEEWNNSHYQSLSEIINNELSKSEILKNDKAFELGKTISSITLKRFYEDKFSESAKTDLRFIKTLDKLCIFLGYENLNEFISMQKRSGTVQKLNDQTSSHDDFIRIIQNCGQQEFDCIAKLPEINLLQVSEFVFENSPYYQRIRGYLHDLQKRDFTLITKNNMSNYEFIDISLQL